MKKRDLSSPGVVAGGSNWQEDTSGGPGCVHLLKLELSARRLRAVVSLQDVSMRASTHTATEGTLPPMLHSSPVPLICN